MEQFRPASKNKRPNRPGRWTIRIGTQLFEYDHWNTWTAHGPACSVAHAVIHEYPALLSQVDEFSLLAHDGTKHVFSAEGNHKETAHDRTTA
jgi:hypothetical protein